MTTWWRLDLSGLEWGGHTIGSGSGGQIARRRRGSAVVDGGVWRE